MAEESASAQVRRTFLHYDLRGDDVADRATAGGTGERCGFVVVGVGMSSWTGEVQSRTVILLQHLNVILYKE